MRKIWNFILTHKEQVALCAIIFFWITGVVQVALGLDYVIRLTPVVLAILTAGALFFWDAPAQKKVIASSIIIVAGFLVEVIGVQTGLLFGDYSYGGLMGFKLFGVPLTIGITWLLVCLSAWHIVLYNKDLPLWQQLTLAGVLVVMFDLILEQFAVAYGIWFWQGGVIPLLNYLCWFIIGIAFCAVLRFITPTTKPSLYVAAMLPTMAAFFWLMLVIA